jgi:citrate lyase subunit beta/citryl-CoA lyase
MIDPATWRSALFVSPLSSRHIERAVDCLADAIVLDLEDAVPRNMKDEARHAAAGAVQALRSGGTKNVLLRMNRSWSLATQELKTAVQHDVSAVVLPKVEFAGHVSTIDEMLTEFESEAAREIGAVKLVLLVESALGLHRIDDIINASERVCAAALGPEDFALDVHGQPTIRANTAANLSVLYAARRNNIAALGYPGTIAEYTDLNAFRVQVEFARELGFTSAFAIHPQQVRILNAVFAPSGAELEYAHKIIAAASDAKGGVVAMDGKMIDIPVVKRAHQLIARAGGVTAR